MNFFRLNMISYLIIFVWNIKTTTINLVEELVMLYGKFVKFDNGQLPCYLETSLFSN